MQFVPLGLLFILCSWTSIAWRGGRRGHFIFLFAEKGFLVEDMMSRWTVCVVHILYIGGVIAFTWKNVSKQIIACERDVISIHWEYDLNPREYVKAKTWFTGVNKTARRIAYWKDTDGFTIESQYKDRVTMPGNNSLNLRDVTTDDEGPYTLIPSLPSSSEPDPRFTVDLIVYISPLNEAGCCKPDINESDSELRASFQSTRACGKPTPTLKWTNSRNKTVANDSLILGSKDNAGTYTVCAIGPAVDRCFTGVKDNLCKSYTVKSLPEGGELKSPDSNHAVTIGVPVSVVAAVIIVAVLTSVLLYRRAKRRSKRRLEEQMPFINLGENVRGVKSLTLRLIAIYKERPQFQKAESDLKLKAKLNSGSSSESDIDINSYTNVLCDQNGVPLKRILITGEVGCGKKTWCNSFTRDWCDAQSPNVSDTDNDNIKFLRQYELLFNVSLKKIKNLSSINDLLTDLRIPLLDTKTFNIGKHLLEHKAIFVIQGLEEYHGSPKDIQQMLEDKHLQQSLIIATSTPTLWDNKYKEIISFDHVIYVQGLDPDEMKNRAEKILHGHGFPQNAIDNFFSLLKERGLEDFTTEPVFFPSLVTMWQTNCSLPSNKAEFLLNVIENKIKDKGPSLEPDTSKYRSNLGNRLIFMHKEFTLHYGKIIEVIGEIAFNILCKNNQHVTFGAMEFDSTFMSQDCHDEETKNFMKDFCVYIGLVSKEEDGNNQIFSFRHIMLQTFLAALYVSTLENEQRHDAAEKLKSANNFSDFLKFINSN